jgi:hypothetical protein
MTQAKANGTTAGQTAEASTKNPGEILDDILSQNLYRSLAEKGDISQLSSGDKTSYMQRLCESLGLNHLTQPFLPLKLNGKEVLYATRGATDQLASVHKLTREILKTEHIQDVYIATCRVVGPDGRFDISTGAVAIGNLKGNDLANALMKAETKAKRRATLCYCGLGFLDESEIETIPRERVEYPSDKPATKGQLVDNAKTQPTEPPPPQKIAGQTVAGDQFTGSPTALKGDEPKWRVGIEKMAMLIGNDPTETLNTFDSKPDWRETCWLKVMQRTLKKLIESELWAYTEEGTLQLLERFGITEIDNASRGQLEALFTDLTDNGVLSRYAAA